MTQRLSPAQTLNSLRTGPGAVAPSASEVVAAAEAHPTAFSTALRKLFYKMSHAVLGRPKRNMIAQYVAFSQPWQGASSTPHARYYAASIDAYQRAVACGLTALDWRAEDAARKTADALAERMPADGAIEELAWLVLLGQVQSVYARDDAARTMGTVRGHSDSSLVVDFYRDMGAFTYYGRSEVSDRRRDISPILGTQTHGRRPSSERAIVISVDPNFFRIFGPTLLHVAQQLPSIDLVFVLCAAGPDIDELSADVDTFLAGLSALNRQAPPHNVRVFPAPTPAWVANAKTFYASSRFLALPELLQEYESAYTIDADLMILRDPTPFMEQTASMLLGMPVTEGPLGVAPWRRFMAGNVVANRSFINSLEAARLRDYLSVGLSEPSSWMLDQNALTYAVADDPQSAVLTAPRPTTIANVMGQWERNYSNAVRASG